MSTETLPERARRLATENQEHVRRERKHLDALTTLLGLPPTASWEDVLGALRPPTLKEREAKLASLVGVHIPGLDALLNDPVESGPPAWLYSTRAAMDRAGAPTAGPDGAPVSDGYRAKWCAEEVIRLRDRLDGRKPYQTRAEPLPGDPGTVSAATSPQPEWYATPKTIQGPGTEPEQTYCPPKKSYP